MHQRRLWSLVPIATALAGLLLISGCDSENSIATVTARAIGTQSVRETLTAVAVTNTPPAAPPVTADPGMAAPMTTPMTTESAPGTTPNAVNTPNPLSAGETLQGTMGSSNATIVVTAVSTTPAPAGNSTAQGNAGTSASTTIPSVTPLSGTITGPNGTNAPLPQTPRATAGGSPTVAPSNPVPTGSPPVPATPAGTQATTTAGNAQTSGQVALVVTSTATVRKINLPPTKTASPIGEASAVLANTVPTAWLDDAPLYSLFVRSFRDSNSDGIGDLQGVIDGLDYIQSLGIGTIWLLPVFKAASYHGYDTIDYYTVAPEYGTNADLTMLIQEVHKRGMNILLDYVANHTSNKSPLFLDAYNNLSSKYADFYLWSNEAHTAVTGFAGLNSMPRLNYDSPDVQAYMTDVALYWLDPNKDGDFSDGIDGWRCDVAIEIQHAFWRMLRKQMAALNPRAILLGEFLTGEAQKIRPYMQGDEHHATFDFPGLRVLNREYDVNGDGVTAGKDDPAFLGTTVRGQLGLYAPGQIVIRLINNHDTNRIMSEVNGDQDRARAAAFWMFTAAGVPIVYYGEEIGMFGSRGKGPIYYDEPRREPLDWYAAEAGTGMTDWYKPPARNNAPDDGISVQEQDGKSDSLLSFYRMLGRLRLDDPVMRYGYNDALKFDAAPVLISRHWDVNTLYISITNFSLADQRFDATPESLFPKGTAYNISNPSVVISAGYMQAGSSVTLAPAGYVLLKFTR